MDEPCKHMLSERSPSQKATYCIVLFMWHSSADWSMRTEKGLMLACGWGGDRVTGRRRGIRVTTNGLGVSFWGMGKCSKLRLWWRMHNNILKTTESLYLCEYYGIRNTSQQSCKKGKLNNQTSLSREPYQKHTRHKVRSPKKKRSTLWELDAS